ncbi:uncharacterized protein LOC123322545 [Coccinella septempunctata]|uniref:uncharacterized protein LOC123322545 n=1 Tax=Coccinella septempunctata TaxID=41139 RepID=UPI001D098808|nr:uncharacterized protein LOC123322545 [Coccinella septempunctata]
MSGVVVVVCVPTEVKENEFLSKQKVRIISPKKDYGYVRIKGFSDTSDGDNSKIDDFGNLSTPTRIPMIKILEEIIDSSNITNAVWSGKGDYVQVMFPLESQQQCESILHKFNENDIGKACDSAVSVLPCCIHYFGQKPNEKDPSTKKKPGGFNPGTNTWNNFISSRNTRLTVDQIVETVKNKAILTFDFVCLLLISTTMCALGLLENSTICLLSSMVMSPMMGPVMAATFGNIIRDTHLKKIGVQNELLGLGVATLVGFCYGTITCILTDKYGNQEWPTYEITSRGELRSLWIGFVIALLSGAAVALGILSDNVASLVGVAISTSLMPPAVNAGLLWSMASVYYIKGNSSTTYHSLDFKRQYSDNDFVELLSLGFISICLTVVNIVCIYLSAVFIFKVKEVAPIAVLSKQRRQFWKYELKNARHLNTLHKEEGEKIRDRLADFAEGRISYDPGDISHYFSYIPKDRMKNMMSTATWSHSTHQIGSMRDIQFEPVSTSPEKNIEQVRTVRSDSGLRASDSPEKPEQKDNCEVPKDIKRRKKRSVSTSYDTRDVQDCTLKTKLLMLEKSVDVDIKMIHTKCRTFLVSSCKENDTDSLNKFQVS